jgi:hypothetical protein
MAIKPTGAEGTADELPFHIEREDVSSKII